MREPALLDTVAKLSAVIAESDKDLKASQSSVKELTEVKDAALVEANKLETDAKVKAANDNYKPFGISGAIIYDIRGRANAGIGISYTPRWLRFKLWK